MRRRPLAGFTLAASAALLVAVPQASFGAVSPGTSSPGQTIEVPGLGALSTGGSVGVLSASCGSAGNCAVGGFYRVKSGHREAFIATEQSGRWQSATEVPGTATLNAGGQAEVESVSCASAGNCAAGGYYQQASGHRQGFVVSEKSGHWGPATDVPGLHALNFGGSAEVSSVSCPSSGNCAAGGSYTDPNPGVRAFVVTEKNGHWGTARNVPLPGSADQAHEFGATNSISCASAGNCAAGGTNLSSRNLSAFVVSAKNGRWGAAQDLIGEGNVPPTGQAQVFSISCASAGNCAAGGSYASRSSQLQAFVASEKNGRWSKAIEVPGLAKLGGTAQTLSVSCASTGQCAAGGFVEASHRASGFVVSERNGHWGTVIRVPESAILNKGGFTEILSVSCAAPGNCIAGGTSKDQSFHRQAIEISETGGKWGKAVEVPGSGLLNAGGGAGVTSVSCASARSCVVAGTYRDASGKIQGFVATHS